MKTSLIAPLALTLVGLSACAGKPVVPPYFSDREPADADPLTQGPVNVADEAAAADAETAPDPEVEELQTPLRMPYGALRSKDKDVSELSYSAMVDYYAHWTAGMIKPTSDAQAKAGELTFWRFPGWKKGKRKNWTIDTDPRFKADFTQSLFTLDVPRFIESEGATDFLEAKRSFYARTKYDKKLLSNTRPYAYLYGWGQLNHPPIRELPLPVSQMNARFSEGFDAAAQDEHPFFKADFQKRLDQESGGTELTHGNRLELLPNKKSFEAKMELVRNARRHVWIGSLAFLCDPSSEPMIQLIEQRVRDGLEVKLLTEGFYARFGGKCTKRIRNAGVQIVTVEGMLKPKTFTSVYHNKIWIRDFDEAISGGQNFAEANNMSDGFNFYNRDTDVRVIGPAVTDIAFEFATAWNKNRKESDARMDGYLSRLSERKEKERADGVRGQEHYERWLGDRSQRMNGVCRFSLQHEKMSHQPIWKLLHELTLQSKSSLLFTSPKMIYDPKKLGKSDRPTDLIMASIQNKARGENFQVDVISNGLDGADGEMTITLNELTRRLAEDGDSLKLRIINGLNKLDVRRETKRRMSRMLDLGSVKNVRAWAYFNFIHAKQWYFDRTALMISSINFDRNASERSYEQALTCMDTELNTQFEHQSTLDMVNSTPVRAKNLEIR